jgi:hypothetical protein
MKKSSRETIVLIEAARTLKRVGGWGAETPIDQAASSNIDTALQLGPR